MAKNKIAGLTIEIGGETTGLSKALTGVNKQSRDLQSELRNVDRLLKLDPKNTELIAQKQKILGEAVGNTKSKLETLKEAEKQAQEQFKKGKISEEQYRALQREVIKTEQDLGKLESQAIKSNAVLSKDEAVKNLKNIGKAAGIAAVAVGGALVGAAVKAGQAADDINTLAKQTGLTTEQIQKFQYASELIDVPLETLTGSMAKLTKNMGTAKEGTGAAAEAFFQLGVSVKDDVTGELRNNQVVFDETIKALSEMTNETERDSLAMEIFGKSAQDLNPLILGGADALTKLGDEAEEAGLILSQDALDSANEFKDSIDKLKVISSGAFAKLGTEIANDLIPFMEKLMEIVAKLPEWFEENKTKLEILGVVVGTITALVIAFNIQQALLASGMTLWGAIATGATAITTALGTAFAFLTSPIGLVILAIGAVIAIGVLLYKNWDTIKEKCIELQENLIEIWNSIKEFIAETINAIKEVITTVWNAIKTVTTTVFNAVKNAILNPVNAAKDGVKKAVDAIFGFFKNLKIPQIKIPKIKLPHFSIEGSFSLNPPSIPHFGVDWYKTGAIFNSPSVIGVGEAGAEAVLPIEKIDSIIASALNKAGGKSQAINLNIGTLVADDYGLKQLERRLRGIRLGENARLGEV